MTVSSNEAIVQDADIQAPRRGEGIAITVDTTARSHSLQLLAINTNRFVKEYQEYVYLDLQNDGLNPIYFYFDAQGSTVDMNPSTAAAATSGPLAEDTTVPKILRANQDAPVRINRSQELFIHVQATGGSSVLRIFPSSKSSQKIQ